MYHAVLESDKQDLLPLEEEVVLVYVKTAYKLLIIEAKLTD